MNQFDERRDSANQEGAWVTVSLPLECHYLPRWEFLGTHGSKGLWGMPKADKELALQMNPKSPAKKQERKNKGFSPDQRAVEIMDFFSEKNGVEWAVTEKRQDYILHALDIAKLTMNDLAAIILHKKAIWGNSGDEEKQSWNKPITIFKKGTIREAADAAHAWRKAKEAASKKKNTVSK